MAPASLRQRRCNGTLQLSRCQAGGPDVSCKWNRHITIVVDLIFTGDVRFAVNFEANPVIWAKHVAIGCRCGRKRLCLLCQDIRWPAGDSAGYGEDQKK